MDSLLAPADDEIVDVAALFGPELSSIRHVWPATSDPSYRSGARRCSSDIIDLYPVEHGAAEIVGYLALTDEDIEVTMDEDAEILVEYTDGDTVRRARLPQVTVTRR